MATTTTKRAPRARKPNLRTALANAREAPSATQHDLGIAPDERVGPAGQMSLWWAPMPELPEDHASARVRNRDLTRRADRVVKCLDVLDEINAIRPLRRVPRPTPTRARERWESTGAANIAASEGPELTYRNRHLYRHVVRIYYRSMGDEILSFEVRNLTAMQATTLASEYARSDYDSVDVQRWQDHGTTEAPLVWRGARLVILPSQASEADPIRLALVRAGFDRDLAPQYAARLHAEGVGELDLAGRLEIPPGEMGSLEYTHGFTPRAPRTAPRGYEIVEVAPPTPIVVTPPISAGEPPAPVEVTPAPPTPIVVTPIATMTADEFFRLHTWDELRDRAARERDPYSAKPWVVLAYRRKPGHGFSVVAGYNRYNGEQISWIVSSFTDDARWDTHEAVEIVEVAPAPVAPAPVAPAPVEPATITYRLHSIEDDGVWTSEVQLAMERRHVVQAVIAGHLAGHARWATDVGGAFVYGLDARGKEIDARGKEIHAAPIAAPISAGEPRPQEPDPRPGFYYVSAIDGARRTIVRGPWINDHAGALYAIDRVRREAERFDHRAAFYAFGTCRSDTDLGPGVLGGALVPPDSDVSVPTCPGCGQPAHAGGTDDHDRHPWCVPGAGSR